ncbi:tail fiber protein [Alishewanella phage vB_AspM_Slicko01]|nr:tail fiber protein [Alishewanella phage vB_AspM_Slicko01]
MAIPNSPNWSTLTNEKPYITPSFPKPPLPSGVAAISLGGIELNNSQGRLDTRYWLVVVDGVDVKIAGANGNGWGTPVTIFEEPDIIVEISLTFDQTGRPLVFYKTSTDELRIFWYDSVLEDYTIKLITSGNSPITCFDFPQDAGLSFTDILLFYVRDNSLFMRVQRDRYNIEYDTGVNIEGIRIVSAGLRIDSRLQVVYEYIV